MIDLEDIGIGLVLAFGVLLLTGEAYVATLSFAFFVGGVLLARATKR